MKIAKKSFLTLMMTAILCFCSTVLFAAALSPVGSWTTIDDKTGVKRSIVNVWQSNQGIIYGKIVKVYPQPGDTGICKNCPGIFKNKPITGLTILWGLHQDGPDSWSGGKVLDPKNGHIYHCVIKVNSDGKSLILRGYIGISLLGRSQVWMRN